MNILTIRTDNPEAELGLYNKDTKIDYYKWQAHKELSITILSQIKHLLEKNNLDFKDLNGLIIFSGPGSFTGLRIGFSVANSFSYGLKIPIVSCKGHDWIEHGVGRLLNGENDYIAVPEYGSEPHITTPVK